MSLQGRTEWQEILATLHETLLKGAWHLQPECARTAQYLVIIYYRFRKDRRSEVGRAYSQFNFFHRHANSSSILHSVSG